MRWAGHEIIKQRVEKYGIDCDLKFGYMDVAIKPRHWRGLQERYEYLQRPDFPYETRLVPKQEITGVIGTEAYIGGLVNMADGPDRFSSRLRSPSIQLPRFLARAASLSPASGSRARASSK